MWAIVAKWKKKKYDLDQTALREVFSAFGRVDTILVSGKGSSAVIQFANVKDALSVMERKEAHDEALERFQLSWANGEKPVAEFNQPSEPPAAIFEPKAAPAPSKSTEPSSTTLDYETLTFQRMQEAAKNLERERKRKEALAKMMQEDASE